ncbi:MAG: hypothetical protein R6V31_11565, partial [Halohasta sp.]
MALYATEGLLEVLIEFAADREPEEANVPIAATAAGELAGVDDRLVGLDPETPVLTHFYLPDAAGSVNAVFGMDLGTPSGGAQARFVSHPTGPQKAAPDLPGRLIRHQVKISCAYCAEFLFVFKAGQGAHNELCKP